MEFCYWTHGQKLWRHSLFCQKNFILRTPRVAIFADIIKILTLFIKTIIKDSRKVRRIRKYASKWNLYLYKAKVVDFW